MASSLKHVDRSDDVDLRIEHGIGNRSAYIDLCGEVEHRIWPVRPNKADHVVLGDVDLMDLDVAAPACRLQVRQRSGTEIIEDENVVPLINETIHEVRSNESCSAGDNRLALSHVRTGSCSPKKPMNRSNVSMAMSSS